MTQLGVWLAGLTLLLPVIAPLTWPAEACLLFRGFYRSATLRVRDSFVRILIALWVAAISGLLSGVLILLCTVIGVLAWGGAFALALAG